MREAGALLYFQQGWAARVNVLSSQQLYLRLQWVESFEYFLFNNQGFIAVRIQEEQVYLSLPPPPCDFQQLTEHMICSP